jgi:predicted enzyme related to lactoylglutathione lyase
MNLNGILIGSEDPKRLADYYARLFGKPGWEELGYSGWRIGSGWLMVGPHDQVHGRNTQPGRIIWNIECGDVAAEFERLTSAGAAVIREPYDPGGDPGGLIATLADPDDNYFQLVTPPATGD